MNQVPNILTLGASVHPLSHKIEWRGIDAKIFPTLRATDYKCPHCIFMITDGQSDSDSQSCNRR